MAITIGSLVYNYDEISANVKAFGAILFVQITGSFFGTLLTYMGSKKTFVNDHSDHRYLPLAVPLCPSRLLYLNPTEVFTCAEKDGLYWNIFATEFLASFVLVLGWLVVRKYEVKGD